MKIKATRWLACVCLSLASCATPALWEATNPREYIALERNERNEAKLKASGLTYRVDKEWNLFYVEKTRLQKSRDYAIRTIGTPITVVMDAVTTIVVVGGAVYILSKSNGYFPNIGPYSAEQQEWTSMQKTLDTMRREERHNSGNAPADTGLSPSIPF